MRLHVVDHPLVAHKLTTLRDERTDSPTFRRLADELVTLLAYEATRDVRTEQVDDHAPRSRPPRASGCRYPRPLVVPILRAGLGMLDGMTRLLPTAEVGFLGMVRDEETLEATTYATRMPDDLSGRQVLRARPDAGHRRHPGRRDQAAHRARRRRRDRALPARRARGHRGAWSASWRAMPVTVVTAAVDERLNEHGFIVPGLGDAGDRLYGTVA